MNNDSLKRDCSLFAISDTSLHTHEKLSFHRENM